MSIKTALRRNSAVSGAFALTLLAVSPFLNGCSQAPSPQTNANAVPQAQLSSLALEDRIKTNFNSDPQLKASNLDVKADMDRHEVMLSGTVESEAVKTKAIDVAKSAEAGMTVSTKIEVDAKCCGAGGMHGGKGGMEGMPGSKGMPGMKGTSGKEHKPQ